MTQATAFSKTMKKRSQASLERVRKEFKQNVTGTMSLYDKTLKTKTVTIIFDDYSATDISLEDWKWVLGW